VLGPWHAPMLLQINEHRSIQAVESTKLPRETFPKLKIMGKKFPCEAQFLGCIAVLVEA